MILGSEFPPGPGGIGTHAYQLALQLSRLGWVVEVLTPQAYVSEGDRRAFNDRQPFDVITLPERESRGGWVRQRLSLTSAAIRDFRPDILLASGRRALWLAAIAAGRYGVPWVAVGHGSEFVGQSAPARLLTAQAISRAAGVVAVSDYTAALVEQVTAPRRLVVISNGADGERFHPAEPAADLCRELGLAGKRVLLTVGHVSERKAQDVVIRALPHIVARHPNVVYVMVGLPTRRHQLEALAETLGVADVLRFAGPVTDERLVEYYNLADLFVLVSRRAADGDVEGYGIVVKEAALCAKPAVVSQGCGLTEAIEEGVTGVSVPPDDPTVTAAAINRLLDDEGHRLVMGQQALEQARRDTWAHRAAAYDALLSEFVSPPVQPVTRA
jgi:phosphatidylinositol alpha-1,6-mannosyltransferase